jgi:hypothetical protein
MKIQWNNFGLRAPAGDYGDGGGFGDNEDEIIDVDDLDEDDDDDDDNIEDDDDDDDFGKTKSRGQSKVPAFDANQLADAITKGLKPAFEQNRPQMSREDIEKQLGKPQLTTDLIKAIRDPETPPEKALEAMQALMNQQADYLLRASGLAIEGKIGELNPRLNEVQEAIRSQREESFATGVVKKFPALRGKGHVVKQAMRILQQQGYNPASPSDALRTVGRTARDIIRQIDPNFSLKGKQGLSFAAPRSGGGGRSFGGSQGRKGPRGLMDSVFPVG